MTGLSVGIHTDDFVYMGIINGKIRDHVVALRMDSQVAELLASKGIGDLRAGHVHGAVVVGEVLAVADHPRDEFAVEAWIDRSD